MIKEGGFRKIGGLWKHVNWLRTLFNRLRVTARNREGDPCVHYSLTPIMHTFLRLRSGQADSVFITV
jgi:hypothetical protein